MIAAYAAIAIVIHVLEAGLPTPLPGIKPGLANVITLIVLLRHGWAIAAWVVVMRVLASAILLGTLMTPTFLLSAGGAAASVLALGLLSLWNMGASAKFSVFGLAMASACAHMAGQFLLAWQLFIPHPGLLKLLPVLLSAALVFGLLSGWLADKVSRHMRQIEQSESGAN